MSVFSDYSDNGDSPRVRRLTLSEALTGAITQSDIDAANDRVGRFSQIAFGPDGALLPRPLRPADYPRVLRLLQRGHTTSTAWAHRRADRINEKLGLAPVTRVVTEVSRLQPLIWSYHGWEFLSNRLQERLAKELEPIVTVGGVTVSQDGIAIQDGPDRLVGSYSQFLLLLDIARARGGVAIGVSSGLLENVSTRIGSVVADYFDLCDDTLRELDNIGYDVIRSTEELMKGIAMRLFGKEVAGFSGADRALAGIGATSVAVQGRWRVFAESIENPFDAIEIFGIQRASGYPVVDESISVEKARRLGTQASSHDPAVVERLEFALNALILQGYLKKGQWPPFKAPPREGTALFGLWKTKTLSCPPLSYPLDDFRGVEFGKLFSLDERLDTLETFDDKYCTTRGELLREGLMGRTAGKDSRSVVEAGLHDGHRAPRDTLNYWAAGYEEAGEQVIRLAVKGREMKRAGRLFAMVTYQGREGRAIMEEGIRSKLQPLLEPASKALSQQELSRLCLTLSATAGIVAESDYSSWNLLMNLFNTKGVARTIENIFGEPGLWTSVHEQFSQCWIFLPVGGKIPGNEGAVTHLDLVESPYCWKGHHGGLEGQFQGFWEAFTFGMNLLALERAGLSGTMLGQGDNHIFHLGDIPDEQAVHFAKTLEEVAGDCGHKTKASEMVLYRAFTYQKKFFVDGSEYRCQLKNAMAAVSIPDDLAPTLLARVSGPYSAMASISNHFDDPLRAYQLADEYMCHLADVLSATDRFLLGVSSREILELVSIPSAAGGPAAATISAFLWRGHVDPLSSAIAGCDITGGLGLAFFEYHLAYPGEVHLEHLIDDPDSIQMTRPVDPTRASMTEIGEVVREVAGHGRIAAVARVEDDGLRSQLCENLRAGQVHPRVLSDIAKAGHKGVRDRLISRFNTTATFKRMGLSQGVDLVGNAGAAEREYFTWFRDIRAKVRHQEDMDAHRSIWDFAEALRANWGLDRLQGATSLSPLTAKARIGPGAGPRIVVALRDSSSGRYRSVYRGSKTEQRFVTGGVKVVQDTSTMKDVAGLMRLRSQIILGGGLVNVLDEVVRSRCGRSPDEIEHLFPRVYGGAVAHRADVHDAIRFDLSCSTRIVNRMAVSSEEAGIGHRDLPIAVQEFMLLGESMLSIHASRGSGAAMLHIPIMLEGLPEVGELEIIDVPNRYVGEPNFASNLLTVSEIVIEIQESQPLIGLGYMEDPDNISGSMCLIGRILGCMGGPGRLNRTTETGFFARDALDKAEVHALSARDVERSTVISGMILSMTFFHNCLKEFSGRISLLGAVRSTVNAISQLYWQHFVESYEGIEYCAQEGFLPGIGRGGRDSQRLQFVDHVSSLIVERLLAIRRQPFRVVPLPMAESGVTRDAAIRMALTFAAIGEYQGPNFGSAKCAETLLWIRTVTEEDLPRIQRIREPYRTTVRRLLNGTGIRILRGSPLELLRSLRTQDDRRPEVVEGPAPRHETLPIIPGIGALREARSYQSRLDEVQAMQSQVARTAMLGGRGAAQSYVEAVDCIRRGHGLALCVGYGQGGSAAALIQAGYTVEGIELMKNIQDHIGAVTRTCPGEVARIKGQHSFKVSDACWGSDGDWTKIGVRAIEESVPDLVYLGIERGGLDSPIEDLLPLAEARHRPVLIVRVVGSPETINEHVGVLTHWGPTTVYAPITVIGGSAVHIRCSIEVETRRLVTSMIPASVALRAREQDSSAALVRDDPRALVTKAIFGTRCGVSGLPLIDAAAKVKEMLDGAEVNTRRYIPRSELESGRCGLEAAEYLLRNAGWDSIGEAGLLDGSVSPRARRRILHAMGTMIREFTLNNQRPRSLLLPP